MDERGQALLDKCEICCLLCQRASARWSLLKFIFNIPLILTSSIMCVMNSMSTEEVSMKMPNVIVNGVSVFVMSINNNLKCAEKFELFKSLSNSYLALAHAIESYDEDSLTREKINELTEKYDVLVGNTPFEDIPNSIKNTVIQINAGRAMPMHLNGGFYGKKRDSKELSSVRASIV